MFPRMLYTKCVFSLPYLDLFYGTVDPPVCRSSVESAGPFLVLITVVSNIVSASL